MIDDETLAASGKAIRPLLKQLDELKELIDSNRPLDLDAVERLERAFEADFVFHSNAIEGNPLTRRETVLILDRGLTVDATSLKDHLEVINLRHAYRFVKDIAMGVEPLTEDNIRDVHGIVMEKIQKDEAGRYRMNAVRITGTEHEPVEPVLIAEHMERFVKWLNGKHDLHPLLVAAGIHWQLVNIHPFRDGNGRVARLLMNFVLFRQGYPIVIVREQDRETYYSALEAGDSGNFIVFSEFVATAALRTARTYERALAEQKRAEELLGGVVEAFEKSAIETRLAYYETWKAKMQATKTEFESAATYLRAKLQGKIDVTFEDFGMIGFDKFSTLLERRSTEETWFFRVRLVNVAGKDAAFVFWFGWGSSFVTQFLRRPSLVSIHISERIGGEWMKLGGPGIPALREIFESENDIYEYSWVEQREKRPVTKADPAAVAATFFREIVSKV